MFDELKFEELKFRRSPSKSKKTKAFKFPSKKEKREKSREKEMKEKDVEKEKDKKKRDKDEKDIEKEKRKDKEKDKSKQKFKDRKKGKHSGGEGLDIGGKFRISEINIITVEYPVKMDTERDTKNYFVACHTISDGFRYSVRNMRSEHILIYI